MISPALEFELDFSGDEATFNFTAEHLESISGMFQSLVAGDRCGMLNALEAMCNLVEGSFSEARVALGIGCTSLFLDHQNRALHAVVDAGAVMPTSRSDIVFAGRPGTFICGHDYSYVTLLVCARACFASDCYVWQSGL